MPNRRGVGIFGGLGQIPKSNSQGGWNIWAEKKNAKKVSGNIQYFLVLGIIGVPGKIPKT